jgi:hypothetical protein
VTAPFDVAAARRLAHDHAATLPPDALPVLLALLAACDALEAASPIAPVATPDPYAAVRSAALALADARDRGRGTRAAIQAIRHAADRLPIGIYATAPSWSAPAADVRAWAASLPMA